VFSQPLPSPRGPGRAASPDQRTGPAASPGDRGARFAVWSRSAPSPDTRPPLSHRGRPPTHQRWISGHYPAFGTTTSRLTPRRASVCLSPSGYSVAYPITTESPTGPSWTTGRPGSPGLASSCVNRSGPCEVSLDHFVNNVAADRRHHLQEPSLLGRSWRDRSHPRCLAPEQRGHRLPRASAGRHSNRPSRAVHFTFDPAASPPPPPHPSSPRRTGHQLPNFNDQSSGRTPTSFSTKLPGVRRDGAPAEAGAPITRRRGGC
jgi:hypothetical protein